MIRPRLSWFHLALVCVLIAALGVQAIAPLAAEAVAAARAPSVTRPVAHNRRTQSKAPTRPPLAPGANGTEGGGEDVGVGTQGESDPLVSNGLGSPGCKGTLAVQLSAADRNHCETSGFLAAPAPTGDYGIDVHIDTGLLGGLSSGGLLSAVQDLFITPLWMGLVWAIHALLVMLEWSFTIDLLDSAAAGGLARGLRQAQMTLTDPWLPMVLAAASVIAVYNGLVRRRVAATLGEVLLMGAMMVGGVWVIADPTGTVGALGQWANQAALGTLAVAAHGTPSAPGHALGESLDAVFAAAIEAPWCYMEFGDVDWCRNPARLDTGLRAAGLAIAARQAVQAGCGAKGCTSAGGTALEHSAELLRGAHTNGGMFLALPANGAARNSINEQGSLLRTLCGSSEATNCHGRTAAQAEFRTAGQTWARMGGLLLIAAGVLGMLLLLGFVAMRLLSAAIFSLLYLLLAPAMVLAPAFGEGGRALFRKWLVQLLGAVISKLLFSFLLGVVLAVLAILSDLSAIGWWTQWLLMSAFWWGAYIRRHQALGIVSSASGHQSIPHRSVVRRVGGVLETRKAHAAARWVKDRHDRSASNMGQRRSPALASSGKPPRETPAAGTDEQIARTLEHEHGDASARMASAADREQSIAGLRGRLERVRLERAKALAGGDWRRAVQLGHRSQRVENEIEHEQGALGIARRVAGKDLAAYARERHEEQKRFLNAQASLPGSIARAREGGQGAAADDRRRDYPRLAALAGYRQEEYERLGPRAQRVARLQIDRELALRNELSRNKGDGGSRTGPSTTPVGRRPGDSSGDEVPPSPSRPVRESSVIRDAREVAAGRKRQLGYDRS